MKNQDIMFYNLQEEVDISKYIDSFTKNVPDKNKENFLKEIYGILDILGHWTKTPIIIEMLVCIIRNKIILWKEIFLDESNNKKTIITKKDIYDEFFKYLHQKEEDKTNSIKNEDRLYSQNKFVGDKYDGLRKEFAIYITMFQMFGTQKSRTTQQINSWWNIELYEKAFQDIFRETILLLNICKI